jgi:ribosomal protein L11 methyltransferase
LDQKSQIDNRQSAIDNPQWWLVTVVLVRDAEEIASALLFDQGSTGIVTLEEHAGTVKLGAYFDRPMNSDDIRRSVEAGFNIAGRPEALISISISVVPDQDWMQKWKEGFEAVEIGNRLIVAPSWKLPANSEGRTVVQIDPGMAFGTGTHETTRLCLEAIERYWHGGSLLDVGTGTGILAIAAALLAPASRVVALDIDPQAVEVARENLAINGVSSAIDLRAGQPDNFATDKFELVVANLTAEVIIDLLDSLDRCLASGGKMILSGILKELSLDVERAMIARGIRVTEQREAGEWCALVGQRA